MNEKKILENELSQLYDKKSKGAKIRSRVNKVDRIRLTFQGQKNIINLKK